MNRLILFFGLAVAVATENPGFSQMGLNVGGTGTDPLLINIFNEVKAFSSPATISVKKGSDSMSGEIDFAYNNGKVRIGLDMTKFKGEAMPPDAVNILKQMGMENVVSISGVTSNSSYVIYPSLKSYVEIIQKDVDNSKDVKFEKTELGEETIEKQKCKKNKIVATDRAGKKQEALVWNATGLKNFPIQIKISDSENEVTVIFKNPKIEPPPASLFQVPEGYKKYNSMEELMKSSFERAMQNNMKK